MPANHTNFHRQLDMATRDDRLEADTRIRFATVSEAFFGIRALDDPFEASRPIPWIPIVGQWMIAAGFDVDDPVEITVTAGKITISSLDHCD
jgi:hypothetical protein